MCFSHRPNPAWFHDRVDAAVAAAWQTDTIADLILCGPDSREARSTLRARACGGDATPFLRYAAARYGAYPNVWFCLANEWDIKFWGGFRPDEHTAGPHLAWLRKAIDAHVAFRTMATVPPAASLFRGAPDSARAMAAATLPVASLDAGDRVGCRIDGPGGGWGVLFRWRLVRARKCDRIAGNAGRGRQQEFPGRPRVRSVNCLDV